MRTSSANAVSSPWTSMTLASSSTLRTSIVTCAWGISFLLFRLVSLAPWYPPRRHWREPCSPPPRRAARRSPGPRLVQGALLVREDAHEVREAGDVEDLDVVLGEATGREVALRGAGPGQEAHDQGDTRGVDVVHALKVEEDGIGVPLLGLSVGGVEGLLGEAVDLAPKVEHGGAGLPAHLRLEVPYGHVAPPSARPFRCRISSTVWWRSSPVTFISSTMLLMRNRPHPRGVCAPSSLASRSGACGSKAAGPAPPPGPLTAPSAAEAETSMRTGASPRERRRGPRSRAWDR